MDELEGADEGTAIGPGAEVSLIGALASAGGVVDVVSVAGVGGVAGDATESEDARFGKSAGGG